MFDWMTWSIELVGILILCVWIIVPIQEFRLIFQRLKMKEQARIRDATPAGVADGERHEN